MNALLNMSYSVDLFKIEDQFKNFPHELFFANDLLKISKKDFEKI